MMMDTDERLGVVFAAPAASTSTMTSSPTSNPRPAQAGRKASTYWSTWASTYWSTWTDTVTVHSYDAQGGTI